MQQKGKRVVIVISGLRGVFYASLEIARRLSGKGAEVIFASSTDLTDRLQPYPYSFQQLPEMHLPPDFGTEYPLAFQESIKKISGEVFLVDLECPVYTLVCLSLGLKVQLLNHFLPIPTYPDLPIPNQPIVPGEGFSGLRLAVRFNWYKMRGKLWLKAMRERRRRRGQDRRSLLIRLGQTMGLHKEDYLYSQTLLPGPYLYFSTLPMLHITARSLDFEHRMRDTERYVGPMILRERKEAIQTEVQVRMDEILSEAKAKDQKIIYCSLSSLKATDPNFLAKLLEVFRHEEMLVVLISLGNKSVQPEGNIPQNIHFFPWLPVQEILPKAHLVINSAGFHSIHECIYYEVPMLSFSLGITDQNGFLARLKAKKLGQTIHMRDAIPDINAKVRALLDDQEVKSALKEMKANFIQYEEMELLERALLD